MNTTNVIALLTIKEMNRQLKELSKNLQIREETNKHYILDLMSLNVDLDYYIENYTIDHVKWVIFESEFYTKTTTILNKLGITKEEIISYIEMRYELYRKGGQYDII